MSAMLIAISLNNRGFSQNAKGLFSNHYKIGINGQYNIFSEAEITPTNNSNLSFEIYKSKMLSLGLVYNFYQTKNWNLKARLQLQWFGNYNGILIREPENITPVDIGSFSLLDNERLIYLPVSAEYLFINYKKINLGIGGGFGTTFYEHDEVMGTLGINNIQNFRVDYQNSDFPFYFSGHIELNLYLNSKLFLFETSLIYKKSFKSFRTGTYEFTNLEMSPDIGGELDQSGDFIGFGLTLYPKRLKRKN